MLFACTYINDFSDVAEVKKLREDLRKIGVMKMIGFKSYASWDLGHFTYLILRMIDFRISSQK